jgi:hypothetical protein
MFLKHPGFLSVVLCLCVRACTCRFSLFFVSRKNNPLAEVLVSILCVSATSTEALPSTLPSSCCSVCAQRCSDYSWCSCAFSFFKRKEPIPDLYVFCFFAKQPPLCLLDSFLRNSNDIKKKKPFYGLTRLKYISPFCIGNTSCSFAFGRTAARQNLSRSALQVVSDGGENAPSFALSDRIPIFFFHTVLIS